MLQLKPRQLLSIIGFIAMIEIVSFIVTFFPIANAVAFLIVILAFFYLTVKKPLWAICVLLAELAIGSKGYLFALSVGSEFSISIRLGMFIVFFLAWAYFALNNRREIWEMVRRNNLLLLVGLFFVFVIIGIIRGIEFGNAPGLIFADMNGYLYLALLLPALTIVNTKESLYTLIDVIIAALIAVSVKILMLLYVFSHSIPYVNFYIYRWIRDAGIGEITRVSLDYTFHRIFFQSQIFALFFLFIAIAVIYSLLRTRGDRIRSWFSEKYNRGWFWLLVLLISSLLISFSRSYWVAVVLVAVILYMSYLIIGFRHKKNLKTAFQSIIVSVISTIASIVLILGITNFPIPAPGVFSIDALRDRASSFSDEAAVSSRWNLLPPLIDEARSDLLLGSGFGTTVSYMSEDPRIKNEENPDGLYTTSTFEWGYLDTITEIGLVGLLIFLTILFLIFYSGIKILLKTTGIDRGVLVGSLAGLLALSVVHFFSPYFNHPLGLGLVIIIVLATYIYRDENSQIKKI